jgi:hypothetical protein
MCELWRGTSRRRLRRDEQHRAEQHGAEGAVAGVEEVGDVRVGGPGPPDRHEEAREGGGARQRGAIVQPGRQLRDADHEDEVEEQLGPGGVALDLPLARPLQAQPRRQEGRPGRTHPQILARGAIGRPPDVAL